MFNKLNKIKVGFHPGSTISHEKGKLTIPNSQDEYSEESSNQIITETTDAEVIIKPKRKNKLFHNYDRYNGAPESQRREGWTPGFQIHWPEDLGLGIESSINKQEIPSQLLEIYTRFVKIGFINEIGNQCTLMSSLLRRILRLHGFSAYNKQVVAYWAREDRGQQATVGLPSYTGATAENSIDAHMITYCNGYVLDFALGGIHSAFGATAPRALIGLDVISDEYQDFGISGQCAWVDVRPQHPIIKHWLYEQKQAEIHLSKEYFRKYRF